MTAAKLEGWRRAQPDGLRGTGTTVAPAVRNLGIEINTVAGAKAVPQATDLDFDYTREDDDTVLAFVGKQRPALGAGWGLYPEKRSSASHVGRQQFIMNFGAGKSQLLTFVAPHDSNWRIGVSDVLKHQLTGRNSQRVCNTTQGRDRGREQIAFDLAEITDREIRFFGKLNESHTCLLAMSTNRVAKRTFGFTHRNTLRIGRKLSRRFHPSSPISSRLPLGNQSQIVKTRHHSRS